MKFFKKSLDGGKSMMELLLVMGVTAILSVVGVIIVNISMDKQRANVLAEGGQRRALVVMEQVNFYNIEPNLNEFTDNDTSGGTFGKKVVWWENEFGISVYNVRKRICQNLLNMIGVYTSLQYLTPIDNPEEPISECAPMGDYFLFYNNEMKSTGETEEAEGGSGSGGDEPEHCDSEYVVIVNCNGTSTNCCPDNGHQCIQPKLSDCCENADECTGLYKACINEQCRCPDGYFQNKNGNCTHCSNGGQKEPVSKESCENCKNWGYNRWVNNKGLCQFDGNCPEGSIHGYVGTDHLCLTCEEGRAFVPDNPAECTNCPGYSMIGNTCSPPCPTGTFRDGNSKSCIDCLDPGSFTPYDNAECEACPNREVVGTGANRCKVKCSTGSFRDSASGNCIDCSDSNKYIPNDPSECTSKCSNRRMNDGGYCIINACPPGQFRGIEGACINCAGGGSYVVESEAECAVCDSTKKRYFMASDNYGNSNVCSGCADGEFLQADGWHVCRSCSGHARFISTDYSCASCAKVGYPRHIPSGQAIGWCAPVTCPNGTFKASTGYCEGCSDPNPYTLYETEDCSKCDNTSYPRQMINGKCAPATCAAGQFQNSANGACVDCSSNTYAKTTAEQCDYCNTQGSRIMIGDWCIPESGRCPTGQFFEILDGGLYCKDCSNGSSFNSNAEECSKCNTTENPRRFLANGKCVKACGSGKFMNSSGSCVSCSTNDAIDAETEDDCLSCSTSGIVRQIDSNGKCVRACDSGYYRNSSGGCSSCNDDSVGIAASDEECTSCGNRKVSSDGKCVKGCGVGKFYAKDTGSCQSCTDVMKYESYDDAECTDSCSDREIRTYQGVKYCVWQCPSGYFRNANLNCTVCGDKNAKDTSKDECDKCPNRKMVNGKCTKACEDNEIVQADGSCHKTCTTGFYATDDKACKACNDVMKYQTYDSSSCSDKCPDREMMAYNGKTYCVWKCPSGYFRNENMNCTGCSDSKASSKLTYRRECAKCTSNRQFNPNDSSDTSDDALGYCTYVK